MLSLSLSLSISISCRVGPSIPANAVATIRIKPTDHNELIVCTKKTGAWVVNMANNSKQPLVVEEEDLKVPVTGGDAAMEVESGSEEAPAAGGGAVLTQADPSIATNSQSNGNSNSNNNNNEEIKRYTAALYTHDGKHIISCDGRGYIRIRTADSENKLVDQLQLPKDSISKCLSRPFELSKDGKYIAAASGSAVRVVNVDPLELNSEHVDSVENRPQFEHLTIEPNGNRILAIPDRWFTISGSMYVFSRTTSDDVGHLKIDEVFTAEWNPAGTLLAVATRYGEVHILENQYESNWAVSKRKKYGIRFNGR
jgi:hypothetical protein